MGKKLKRYFLPAFGLMVVIALVIGYLVWNQPHRSINNADAVKTTAITLYNIFSKNKTDSTSLYLNKVVEVSGKIESVSKNQQNQQIIFLKTNVSGGFINCTMEKRVKNSKQGDKVILKGICRGYIGGDMELGLPGDVYLTRCYRSS